MPKKDHFCKYIVKKYVKNPDTKTTYIETESQPETWIDKQTYDRIVDSSPFFRRLGGSEYHERSYTSQGYTTIKMISKSPERLKKTVRWFVFDNEYPNELIKQGIGDYKINLNPLCDNCNNDIIGEVLYNSDNKPICEGCFIIEYPEIYHEIEFE